ncbi:hypothetical protein [Helicobacter rodentium]|nr:hypothetical protein [Helicobacter rodentium]
MINVSLCNIIDCFVSHFVHSSQGQSGIPIFNNAESRKDEIVEC